MTKVISLKVQKVEKSDPKSKLAINGKKLTGKNDDETKRHSISGKTIFADDLIDVETDKYPYCIVWTPLPIVTWFLPIIGHTGIANSKGIIHDFSDDFKITVDNFSFGQPTKYYQFYPNLVKSGSTGWDRAIEEISDHYSRTRHSFFFNNCHQYIADVLNKVNYAQRTDWTQTAVWWKITFRSRYTGFQGFLRQWWPFTAIFIAVIVFLCLII